MTRERLIMLTLLSAALCVVLPLSAAADPLPGRDVPKFTQVPMVITPVPDASGQVIDYYGHDELSTAYTAFDSANNPIGYQGQFMADDFADRFNSPVVHVKWWGSYMSDQVFQPVDQFLISFESDIPANPDDPDSFSRPGDPLLNQVVTRGSLSPSSGTFTETRVRGPDPILGESLYEYNAELHLDKEFPQKEDTVYWLKIVALVDVTDPNTPLEERTQWGWHNRDYTVANPLASTAPAVVPGEAAVGTLADGTRIWHFQDDAVTGGVFVDPFGSGGRLMPDVFQEVLGPTHYLDAIDGPDGISQFSKDLAFELYTIPEPSAMALLSIAVTLALAWRRRH